MLAGASHSGFEYFQSEKPSGQDIHRGQATENAYQPPYYVRLHSQCVSSLALDEAEVFSQGRVGGRKMGVFLRFLKT